MAVARSEQKPGFGGNERPVRWKDSQGVDWVAVETIHEYSTRGEHTVVAGFPLMQKAGFVRTYCDTCKSLVQVSVSAARFSVLGLADEYLEKQVSKLRNLRK